MNKIDLFLFDFDGLLVNTEHLHFAAYQEMCKARNVTLEWDFLRFCEAAHFHAMGVRDALHAEFSELKEVDWDVLYAEKKRIYLELLKTSQLQLMPGVGRLLKELEEANLKRCVVTHSPIEQIEQIKKALPVLQSIPHWITREDYELPKPDPQSYQLAIQRWRGNSHGKTIGFEDSLRGLRALQGAHVDTCVLICPKNHPQMKSVSGENVEHYETMEDWIRGNR